jgi:hypothetical protein
MHAGLFVKPCGKVGSRLLHLEYCNADSCGYGYGSCSFEAHLEAGICRACGLLRNRRLFTRSNTCPAQATGHARLVMRQRGTSRLLLNARLYGSTAMSKMMGGKGATFAVANFAAPAGETLAGGDGDGSAPAGEVAAKAQGSDEAGGGTAAMRTYALRVKRTEQIDDFIAVVEQRKQDMAEPEPEHTAPGQGQSGPVEAV